MALYSFDNFMAASRLSKQPVVADTSYLITFADPTALSHGELYQFHKDIVLAGTDIFINVIVRHEFLQKLRYGRLVETLRNLLCNEPSLDHRFRHVSGVSPHYWNEVTPTESGKFIQDNAEKIYKDYVRQGDAPTIIKNLKVDLWAETKRLEKLASATYFGTGGSTSWDELGAVINETGMAATDCMIANFARDIEAKGILTCDCDYAQYAHKVDVYMPRSIATQCKGAYDPSID